MVVYMQVMARKKCVVFTKKGFLYTRQQQQKLPSAYKFENNKLKHVAWNGCLQNYHVSALDLRVIWECLQVLSSEMPEIMWSACLPFQ